MCYWCMRTTFADTMICHGDWDEVLIVKKIVNGEKNYEEPTRISPEVKAFFK